MPIRTKDLAVVRRHPLEDRPRERLLRRGALVLSDAELLAILLGDDASTSTLVEALGVLEDCGGLAGLLSASQATLSRSGLCRTRTAQYAAFDPRHADAKPPRHPVVWVTWWAVMSFCRWLATAFPGARLPAEEEWEYAARAGTTTRYWSGDSEEDLARVDWYLENSGAQVAWILESSARSRHQVGEKAANDWGLYDIHGNAGEWTLSECTESYGGREGGVEHRPEAVSADEAAAAAAAATFGGKRVYRGGCFRDDADQVRVAGRSGFKSNPDSENGYVGFRVVLPGRPEP